MTTNRMGLEQMLSDERLEDLAKGQYFFAQGAYEEAKAMARELLAYRAASKKPVADVVARNKPGEERKCDIRWRRFDVASGPLFAAPPLAVTVPDEVTFEQARLMAYGLTPAEAFQKAWNHLRGAMMKSVTNEP